MVIKYEEIFKGTFIVKILEPEIVSENSAIFYRNFESILKEAKNILIDFMRVEYIDSSGLGILIYLARHLKIQGKLCIFNLKQRVKKIIYLANLEKMISIVTNQEEALKLIKITENEAEKELLPKNQIYQNLSKLELENAELKNLLIKERTSKEEYFELYEIESKLLREAIQELEEAKKYAEKANKLKTEFISNMSHELRTPLNGIVGFAEVLKDMETSPEKKECLEIISISAKHLQHLINDILSLAKIEAGKKEIHRTSLQIKEIEDYIEKIFRKQIHEKGLNYLFECDINISEIMADKKITLQILCNLISNAIKFTERGYIKVSVKEINLDNPLNKTIEFSIIDTGIGIEEEKQKRLYEPFEQGEYFLTKKYGGPGLGLALTKSLVDLINGEIEIESQVGKGTRVNFRLPFKNVVSIDREEMVERMR